MKPIDDVKPPSPEDVPVAAVLEDDEEDLASAQVQTKKRQTQQKAREAAFLAEYTWTKWDDKTSTWKPYRLELGMDRWTWWHRMELHNAPVPRESWADVDKWSDAHVPTAWSLLYLCSHDPETILNLVPSPVLYWYAVNEWAKIHCPGEKWIEALTLMRRMEQEMKLTLALPRPTGGKGRRPGNAPAP